MLGHEEKTVSPQESMFLLRGGPRYPPLSLSLFKKIFLVFIATGEWALSLPHPFFFFPYSWNGRWSHIPSQCCGMQSCWSSLLGLVTYLAGCLLTLQILQQYNKGTPVTLDIIENRTSYQLPIACTCHCSPWFKAHLFLMSTS